MKNIKVAHVVDILNVGGAEQVAVNLVNSLHKEGINVTMICLLEYGVLEKNLYPDIKKFSLKRSNKFSLFKMYKLSKKLQQYHIVHIHMRHVYRYVSLVKLLFPFPGKVIFHDHSSRTDIDYKVYIYKYLIKLSNEYIGTSEEVCEWTQKILGYPKNHIWKLVNTIHRKKYLPSLNKTSNKKIIVVSNIRKEKNLEFIIDLFSELKKDFHKIKMDIYGQVIDDEYFLKLQRIVKTLNLEAEEDIRFITDCTDIQQKLGNYLLALHSAKRETGPLVLIEYLSQGLPFLSYNTGEVAKITSHHFPNMVINNFNKAKWRDRIKKIINNSDIKTKKDLISVYENYFSEERYVNKCIEIYKKTLNY